MEQYVATLLVEIELAEIAGGINTIYIGGGTPTALPVDLLCRVLDAIRHCGAKTIPETTVEANPGTLTPDYLQAIKAHGVNRLSIGLQTTHDYLLKAIGRIHSYSDFLMNFRAARDVGFSNINVDLMFGLPGQTLQNWKDTLNDIIAIAPEHVSAYSLTPAEDTPLWHSLEIGGITLPSDKADREMYHVARELLVGAGYIHYELSNFAKPGFASRHNVNCWQRVPYRAFGIGASSFDGQRRWRNTNDLAKYLAHDFAPRDAEMLSPLDAQSETMFLGLRLMQGVAEVDVPQVFMDEVERQIKNDLLTREGGYVRLTPRGMDLANQVFEGFV